MATKSQIANFIETITPMAIRQCKAHGDKIFASVCIAQACHESGYGTSKKMADANAVFGIKVGKSAYMFGSAWKGKAYKREGLLLGVFLEIIFFTRFMLEFIKNDQELFEAGHLLNMGQLLSLPFIIWGIYLIIRAYKRPALP
jgi:hypothetical protein